MAEIDFTPRQKDAIYAPVSNILVSAAAGSGKTAVLTRRIIENLLDPERDVGISDMLVVTYTKAASGELKDRISAAISDAYAKDITNRKLRKQLMDMESAHISTIHSFCSDLIKEYHEVLSLPSSMNISTSEAELIYKNIMDSVIDERYEKDTGDFVGFVNQFTSLQDKKLGDSLLGFYKDLQYYSEGIEYVKMSEERLMKVAEQGIDGSDYLEQVKEQFDAICKYSLAACESAISFFKNCDKPYAIQYPTFESDREQIISLISTPKTSYAELAAIRIPDFVKMQSIQKTDKDADYLYFEGLRNTYKDLIKDFISKFFGESEDSIKRSAKKSALFCRELYKTLKAFDEAATAEKKRRALFDYNDLEKYAYKLLCGECGSEIAEKVAERFKQIYIDEYQDINPLQDALFSAIGRNNRFMVGDIKQSIYGFRGSAPRLFADYREKYKDYDKKNYQENVRIFLTENFRCDSNIIKFSNTIFKYLFKHDRAKVPYLPEDALVFKKKSESAKSEKVTVSLVERGTPNTPQQNEAKYIAREIARLIKNGRKPSEIAIIMRKTAGLVDIYGGELEKLGIKYKSATKKDFYKEPEIMLICSLLFTLDNPRNDIALSAWLTGPFFGFTLDELSRLALTKEKGVYGCLLRYMEENDDALAKKCRDFNGWLYDCRRRAREMSVSEFIRYIFTGLSFEALLMAGSDCPEEVAGNLGRFLSIAVDFEKRSFRTLSDFVRYLERIKAGGIEAKDDDDKADKSEAVSIMTVHKSKGLEFPVCFVCNLAGQLNTKDSSKSLLVDRKLGIALRHRDEGSYIKYDTFMRKAASLHISENMMEEEMRVLYVALTRAKEKLYVVASAERPEEFYKNCLKNRAGALSYVYYSTNRYLIKWILPTLEDDGSHEVKFISEEELAEPVSVPGAEIQNEDILTSDDEKTLEKIREVLDFEYPWSAEQSLPSKLAVSALYPEILDESEDTMNREVKEIPDFMSGEKKHTAAERGTATHVFMQFCDFERVEKYGAEKELERLTEERFITPESAKLVYTDKVEGFFASELYSELKSSKKVYREYRFNVQIPASEFSEQSKELYEKSGSKILVQGVIDCFFETEKGTYKIIDYKTDRAYGDDPEKTITDEYRYQLMYYKSAIEKITNKKVEGASIYAFDLGKEISVDIGNR